ncbi:MAG TPA: cyclic nucleotide-binding domain-containing protein [Ilumatobacteraceae bacterium]|nr:cyclic nucleotide-binding domain-containing protein [Ilumatobacteraceae bacterium]
MRESALHNRVLVRFSTAYFLATVAEWVFFVGGLVYAFDKGGARATGFASVALLLPTALAAPASGSAPRRHNPHMVLLAAYSAETIALAGAAVGAFVEAPVAVVIGLCAVAAAAFTFLGPASAVSLPAVVRSTRELTTANLWIGACDGTSTLAGSLLATILLAAQGAALALAGGAVLTALSVAFTLPQISRNSAAAVCGADIESEADSVGATRLIFRSIVELRQRPGVGGVLAVAGGQFILVGALDLIVVVLANETLGLGEAAPGLLIACVGIGAMLGAIGSSVLVRRRRLAPLLARALISIIGASLFLGVAPTLAAALLLLPVIGCGRTLVDLTSRMLLQRATPPQALAPIFGAIEFFAGVGMVLGSIGAQALIAIEGVDAALIGLAVFFALLLVLTWRSLRVADNSADIPIVAISLLRRVPAFAPLLPLALETVARTAEELPTTAGQVVMTEGEAGDTFYAVADGSFDIVHAGKLMCTVERGASFGEVALLADVPRTATITCTRQGSLLAVQRAPFLVAMTGSDTCRRAAWGVIRTMGLDLDGEPALPTLDA